MTAVRRLRHVAVLGFVVILCVLGRLRADESTAEERMRTDLTYLASDECEGRGVATKGNALAAEYIAAQFKKAGLKPGGKDGSYFQPFTIDGGTLEEKPTLFLKGPKGQVITLLQGKDYEPMGMSASGKLEDAPLVFAGFGLTVTIGKDKEVVYDDYKDLDVKGKVVILLRATFRDEDKDPPFSLTQKQKAALGSMTDKIANAAKHGAIGVLLVNDRVTAKDGDQLMPFSMFAAQRAAAKVPVFQIARALADQILQGTSGNGSGSGSETGLLKLEKDIDRDLKPVSAELADWKANGEVKTKQTIDARNIIGVLEAAGPLAKETVIVGAHYDHLGYGGPSSLARLRNPAIHHGADDNGSGSTAIMELARRFGAMKDREGRRLVFMCFSGEELGLFGSKHYCDHPLFPIADTVAMFNLDMVGRLVIDKQSEKERLLVQGSGTAKSFNDLLDTVNKKYDFKMVKTASGFGPSDHASFYAKKIPVLFCWTGDHGDYHRPTDTADRINYKGMAKIVDMSVEVVSELTTVKDRPEYVSIGGGGSRGGPRIGVSFKEDSADGAVVDAIIPDSPADKAGLKINDRIVEVGGKSVKNLEGFMTQVREFKAGQEVAMSIMRGDKKVEVKVTPVQLPVFGLQPDYNDDKEGVLLKGVAEGSAAEKGGLKGGDRIVELAGKNVKNLEGYMDLLYSVKIGQPVEMTVMRDGKKVTLKLTPE